MRLLNDREHRNACKRYFNRYSDKYIVWAGPYYVTGADRVSQLGFGIATELLRGNMETCYIEAEDLEAKIKSSPNGVVILGRGTGLENEPVIFTVIEDRTLRR